MEKKSLKDIIVKIIDLLSEIEQNFDKTDSMIASYILAVSSANTLMLAYLTKQDHKFSLDNIMKLNRELAELTKGRIEFTNDEDEEIERLVSRVIEIKENAIRRN